jgi:lysophospholipase L1-like esterase
MKNSFHILRIVLTLLIIDGNLSAQITSTDICNNNIRHYWHLDETTGSDLQDVRGNNNASERFNTFPSQGKIGGSQYFNDTSEVNIPNDNDFNWTANSSFSLEFWMKKTSACPSSSSSANNVIIGRDDPSSNLHWWIGASCENGGRISFNLFDVSGNGAELVGKKNVTDGIWHHIVVARDGSLNITIIYVDGIRDTSLVRSYSSGFQSVKNINVGWLDLNAGYHYKGYLDELAVYNIAMPQNIVLEHYNSGNGLAYCNITPVSRLKIMSLGNSMTQGWTDGTLPDEQMRSYRYDLKNFIEGNGFPIDFTGSELTGSAYFSDCQNAGISGTRDQYLVRMLTDGFDPRWGVQILNPPRPYLDEYNPDLILLDVGTNDVTHEVTPWSAGTEKITDLLNLVDEYEQRANKTVTVYLALIINRRLGEPLRDKTSDFNDHLRALAQARINAGDHIVIVDMEHDAGFEYNDADMSITDPQGLHPNETGYTKMALAWFNKLSPNLAIQSFKPKVLILPSDAVTVNNVYNSRVFALANPTANYSFIASPSGMSIDAQTGKISWTPSVAGDYNVSVLVSNSNGSDTASYVLHVTGTGLCLDETFTDLAGTIEDNSGANNYKSNMDCLKLIQPGNAGSITLTFLQFNTEAGYDFVRVYNGSTTSAPLLGQFSGNNIPPVLTSTGGSMLIRFTTDGGVVAQGWSASYTSNSGCLNETMTDPSGTLADHIGSGNYLDNLDCQKLIQPSGATSIVLNFTQFNTEAGYDFVRVYNGPTTSSPLLGQFSGNNLPPVLTANSGSMLIRFTTDGGVVAPGWSATYSSSTASCTDETFTGVTGTVTDNSGSGNYIDNMDCRKLIQPVNASSITLTFNQFSTEAGYDFVRIYDGPTTASPLLGQFSGNTLPPVLTANSGSMLIRFTTDGGVVAPGWSAGYTSTTIGCTNETFTDPAGTVTDNSGAGNYLDNMDCQKLIQPVNAGSITLTFTQFNTEPGYDFVWVYNGPTTSSPLLGKFSGNNLPPVLTSSGGSILIRFTSDGGVVGQGWSANYQSNYGCTAETLTDPAGTLTDHNGTGNYADNLDCQKLIQVPNAGSITLSFSQFSTEAGYDFVRVYNGATTSSPLLGQFSGNNLPPSLTSTGGSMLIRFTTDGGLVSTGWSASYTSSGGGCTNETFTNPAGTVTDNSGANNYVDNMDCLKLIQVANAGSITLTFSQFNTEAGYDFVRVYNGPTTAYPLLGQYSGNNLPPVLTSTGGTLLIRFTSDGGVVAQGWEASYTSNAGGCSNETFSAPTGTVTDNSGNGNYSDNMDCQKLIQPTNAGSITLSFTQFNTEANYDFVRVYNGPTTSSPLLGQFSGNNLPPSLTSTGGSMLIRFTTDGGVVGQGWSATYTSNYGCTTETLTNASGALSDHNGTGNYTDNLDCQKLIQPVNAGSITLTFTQFSTEAGYDFVRVYNGPTTSSPLLGQYSGNSLPPVLTSTGGSMLIRFTTDGGVVAQGWSAQYTSTELNPQAKSAHDISYGDSTVRIDGMHIVVYPNPIKEILTVETLNTENQEFTFELMSTTGQVILNQKANMNGRKFGLDVSGLTPGIYVLKVTSDHITEFVRVIKQ